MTAKRQVLHLILKIIEKGLEAAESIDTQLYYIENRERNLKKLQHHEINKERFLESTDRAKAY